MQTSVAIHERLSPIHLILDEHFRVEVLSMPRREESETSVAAMFYEPLYTYRDQFFTSGSLAALESYLRSFETLRNEAYYEEELIDLTDTRKLSELRARVDSLTSELEVYLLMEAAK